MVSSVWVVLWYFSRLSSREIYLFFYFLFLNSFLLETNVTLEPSADGRIRSIVPLQLHLRVSSPRLSGLYHSSSTTTLQGASPPFNNKNKIHKENRSLIIRIPSSGMLRRVLPLVRTEVSEERSVFIIRVTRIYELGKTLLVTSNRHTLRRNTMRATRRNIPEDGILHSHRRENLRSCTEIFSIPYEAF
jgi:hypothetical protein